MKTSELIDAVALSQGVSKAEAKRNVDAVLDAIRLGIEQDHEVRLTNIGTFRVSEVAARKARNPATGDTIEVPAMNRVSFKASESLKQAVR